MRKELYATLQKKIEAATGIKREDSVEYYTDCGYLDTKFEDHVYSLADVLRAMQEVDLPDDEFFAAYPYRDTKQKGFWLCHKKERDFDMNRDEFVISSKQWNLALPLRLQEDAVGEWLITVIK